MPFNTKDILRDGKGKPIPQYFDEYADAFKPMPAPNGGNAQEPFTGSADYTKTFSKPMTTFCIKNSGSSEIQVIINNYSFPVDAGEYFEENFYPFTEVKIRGNSKFKAYGKGSGGVAQFVVIDEYLVPRTQIANISTSTSNANKYKGSIFQMNKTKVLRSFAVNSNAATWELWEVKASDNTLLTKLTSGSFTGVRDGSYNPAVLNTPFTLTSGKKYMILTIFADGAFAYAFAWTDKATNNVRVTYPINTDSMTVIGVSMQGNAAPVIGDTSMITQNYVYDFKLGLADK